VSDEVEDLRTRVVELERQVRVLFEQTGSTDWAVEASKAPPASDEVRLLASSGEERKAAKLYMEQTGAGVGEAVAALGELARELRGSGG
jgi:hypothetical protein